MTRWASHHTNGKFSILQHPSSTKSSKVGHSLFKAKRDLHKASKLRKSHGSFMQSKQRTTSLTLGDRPQTTRSSASITLNKLKKWAGKRARPSTNRGSSIQASESNFSTIQTETINLCKPQTNSSIMVERRPSINSNPVDQMKPKRLFDQKRGSTKERMTLRPLSKNLPNKTGPK